MLLKCSDLLKEEAFNLHFLAVLPINTPKFTEKRKKWQNNKHFQLLSLTRRAVT